MNKNNQRIFRVQKIPSLALLSGTDEWIEREHTENVRHSQSLIRGCLGNRMNSFRRPFGRREFKKHDASELWGPNGTEKVFIQSIYL